MYSSVIWFYVLPGGEGHRFWRAFPCERVYNRAGLFRIKLSAVCVLCECMYMKMNCSVCACMYMKINCSLSHSPRCCHPWKALNLRMSARSLSPPRLQTAWCVQCIYTRNVCIQLNLYHVNFMCSIRFYVLHTMFIHMRETLLKLFLLSLIWFVFNGAYSG